MSLVCHVWKWASYTPISWPLWPWSREHELLNHGSRGFAFVFMKNFQVLDPFSLRPDFHAWPGRVWRHDQWVRTSGAGMIYHDLSENSGEHMGTRISMGLLKILWPTFDRSLCHHLIIWFQIVIDGCIQTYTLYLYYTYIIHYICIIHIHVYIIYVYSIYIYAHTYIYNMYITICIYIYMYIYTRLYIYTYTHIYIYIYIISIWYPPKTYLFVVFTGICSKLCTFWAYIFGCSFGSCFGWLVGGAIYIYICKYINIIEFQ